MLQLSGQTYTAGQDYSVTLTGLTNPNVAGPYGPFALRTRYRPAGQQVDANLIFGCVYITGSAGTLGAFSVTVVGAESSSTVINKSGNTLSFKFTIGVSLWRYDTFTITADSRWTIGPSATCSSADYQGKVNNFNGTSASSPHSLQCVVAPKALSPSQVVYIYGLAVDGIDLFSSMDNQFVDLRVTAVSSPDSVYSTSYLWTVTTSRFGTATVLETAAFSQGPQVSNDVVSLCSWRPTWGFPTASLFTGQSIFMDLTFVLTSAIPSPLATSYISITVSENIALGDTTNWFAPNCYVVTYFSRTVDCGVVGNVLTISGLPAVSSGTVVKVRSVVAFTSAGGSTAQVTSLKTYQGLLSSPSTPGYLIDSGSGLSPFLIATAAAVLPFTLSLTPHVYNDRGTPPPGGAGPGFAPVTPLWQAGGTGGNLGLQFIFSGTNNAALNIGSVFTIYCPFTQLVDDFSFTAPSPAWTFVSWNIAATIEMDTYALGAGVSPGLTMGTSGVSPGTIVFTGGIVAGGVFPHAHQHLMIYNGSGTSANLQLPRISNNFATAYECQATIATSSQPLQTAIVRFSVLPQPWATIDFSVPCTDQVEGVPGIFTIQPGILPLLPSDTIKKFYVEVEFTAVNAALGLGAGLTYTQVSSTSRNHDPMTFAVSYPFDKGGIVPANAQLYVTSAASTVVLGGFGTVPVGGTGTVFYFPIGGLAGKTTVSVTIRSLYYLASDPRYKFVTFQGTDSTDLGTPANAWTSVAGAGLAAAQGSATGINGNAHSGLYLNVFLSTSPSGSEAYSYVVLPTGVTWQTPRGIKNLINPASTGTNYGKVYWFSSTQSSFAFPGVLFSSYLALASFLPFPQSTSSTGTLLLSGFVLPLGASSSLLVTVATGPVYTSWASAAAGACLARSSISFSSTSGPITNLLVSPTAVKQKGADGVSVKQLVSFSLSHGIPTGGTISMTFDVNWSNTGTCSLCLAGGLTPVTGNTVLCALTGNSVVVSGFTAFATPSTSLTIEVRGLLPPQLVTSTPLSFVTSLSSQTSSGSVIDSASIFSGTLVTVTPGSNPGTTTWAAKQTFPSVAGTTNVDLYLKFSFAHALPTCGIITLTSPLAFKQTGDIKNACFLSPLLYSSCTLSGSQLSITLSQDYSANTPLELYLDAMVDNPSNASPTSLGFSTTTSWATVTVDTDIGTVQGSQNFQAAPALTTTLSSTSVVSFAPKTAGEEASYIFEFKDTANFAASDQYWVVFPQQYDYFLGDALHWFSSEPFTYYLDCTCSQLGTAWCTVDHNIVVVSGNLAFTGGTQIAITLNGVRNPSVGETSSFQLYHVDSSGSFISINQSFGSVTTVALAENMSIRSVEVTNNRLFRTADYTWRVYVVDTMFLDSQLQVHFPPEYDLEKLDQRSSYACQSVYTDTSPGVYNSSLTWNSASSCAALRNTISLPPPATQLSFSAAQILKFTVQQVGNPQYAQSRKSQGIGMDLEVTDGQLWPLYPYWVSKFTLFVYRTGAASLKYTARSYPNMNAAYAGFYQANRPLLVNNYIPQSKSNRIVVYPGTQTPDLYITTSSPSQPLAAKQIVFSPATSTRTPDGGRLKYTSAVDKWTLLQSAYSVQFRVAAGIDLPKGLYYIQWSNNETKQTGRTEVQYDPPVSTLVEVGPKTLGKYVFSVAAIPSVPAGSLSLPIKVSITNSPHTDVIFNIYVDKSSPAISILSAGLIFGPDVSERYFQIQVASNFDVVNNSVQTLKLTLSGTDAATYSTPSSLQFLVISQASAIPGTVVSWGIGLPTRTTVTISPKSDQPGALYYFLAASGAIVPSFVNLKDSVPSLLSQNHTSSGTVSIPSDPQDRETWVEFQHRLYTAHLQSSWVGALAVYPSNSEFTLTWNWLWAGTTYQLSGYLDTFGVGMPEVRTEYFTTLPMAESQPFTVRFQGVVQQALSGKVAEQTAAVMGVNPLRLYGSVYASNPGRALQGAYTTFTYTLLSNRFVDTPSPSEQAKLSQSAIVVLASSLASIGITNTLDSVSNNPIQFRVVPQWISPPTSQDSTPNSVTVSLQASVEGELCCVALTSNTAPPSAEQVVLGLDATNTPGSSVCIPNDLQVSSLLIPNLQSRTSYFVYCTATDAYPQWPTVMSYSATSPMNPVAIATKGVSETSVTTCAQYFASVFVLLLSC